MNLKTYHTEDKPLQTKVIFNTQEGNIISIQMKKDALLKEHITKVPAMLICIDGEVIFENENKVKETLHQGDFINIEANVKHWLSATDISHLILIK
jgi:quercetin dioxygenase-like cupin family protein